MNVHVWLWPSSTTSKAVAYTVVFSRRLQINHVKLLVRNWAERDRERERTTKQSKRREEKLTTEPSGEVSHLQMSMWHLFAGAIACDVQWGADFSTFATTTSELALISLFPSFSYLFIPCQVPCQFLCQVPCPYIVLGVCWS